MSYSANKFTYVLHVRWPAKVRIRLAIDDRIFVFGLSMQPTGKISEIVELVTGAHGQDRFHPERIVRRQGGEFRPLG
jgi:hypothetical protein